MNTPFEDRSTEEGVVKSRPLLKKPRRESHSHRKNLQNREDHHHIKDLEFSNHNTAQPKPVHQLLNWPEQPPFT